MLLNGSASAQKSVDEGRSAPATGIVEIMVGDGFVQVLGWDRDSVRVTGTLASSDQNFEMSGDSFGTLVQVEGAGSAYLKVQVPERSLIEAGTVRADVSVSGIRGGVFLQSVKGDFRVHGSPKEVDVKSINGEVEISVKSSRVNVNSTAGRITLTETSGEADLRTVSGNIVVQGGELRRGRFKSISGDVRFEGKMNKGGVFEFETHSGAIELTVSKGAPVDFLVSTYSGRIENDFQPNRVPRQPSDKVRRKLAFSTRGPLDTFSAEPKPEDSGRARVTASSFSGSVRIKKK